MPADAWLLDAKDLHLQEAALTGESLPVEKTAGPAGRSPPVGAATLADASEHRVLMGSSVVSGSAQARGHRNGAAHHLRGRGARARTDDLLRASSIVASTNSGSSS